MTENKNVSAPRRMLDSALRMVKGDNTTQLMEQFTAEMTLVAEGLCEDQSKLRAEAENLGRELDRRTQRIESEQQAQETALRETQQALERRLDALESRAAALEEQLRARQKPDRPPRKKLLSQLTVLVGIVCGSWVLVTILNLFR